MTYASRANSMPSNLTGKDPKIGKPVDAAGAGEDLKEEATETAAAEAAEAAEENAAAAKDKPKKKLDVAGVLKGAPMGNKNAAGPHGGGSASIYHSSHSEAMSAAHDQIKAKGYEVSDDNWQQHVAGTRKPGEGKTNQYHIPLHQNGKETDKYAHVQVYNRGNNSSSPYELNAYVDSGKPKVAKAEVIGV